MVRSIPPKGMPRRRLDEALQVHRAAAPLARELAKRGFMKSFPFAVTRVLDRVILNQEPPSLEDLFPQQQLVLPFPGIPAGAELRRARKRLNISSIFLREELERVGLTIVPVLSFTKGGQPHPYINVRGHSIQQVKSSVGEAMRELGRLKDQQQEKTQKPKDFSGQALFVAKKSKESVDRAKRKKRKHKASRTFHEAREIHALAAPLALELRNRGLLRYFPPAEQELLENLMTSPKPLTLAELREQRTLGSRKTLTDLSSLLAHARERYTSIAHEEVLQDKGLSLPLKLSFTIEKNDSHFIDLPKLGISEARALVKMAYERLGIPKPDSLR